MSAQTLNLNRCSLARQDTAQFRLLPSGLLEASEADREISERVTAFVKTLRNRLG